MHTTTTVGHEELAQRAFTELTHTTEPPSSSLKPWSHQCHAASLRLVNSGLFPGSRVARGSCDGVGGQHSWVVLGHDCYDPTNTIIDPTLWSYDDSVRGIWVGVGSDRPHTPQQAGDIWEWGKPVGGSQPPIELKPANPFSDQARLFLDILGPLDRTGWATLANAPVQGWPADEIMPAINECVGPLVPIDVIGMLTDENPGGLYLPGEERA